MANPITPSGHRRDLDPVEEAQRQDRERLIREDNEHFERTGENRPPRSYNDPLVDNDRPNVAYDGDSYDDRLNHHTASGEYSEDNPTRIISPDLVDDMRAMHGVDIIGITGEMSNRRNPPRATGNSRPIARSEREAYIQRERVKEDKDFQAKTEETKKKFTSAIKGLQLDEE